MCIAVVAIGVGVTWWYVVNVHPWSPADFMDKPAYPLCQDLPDRTVALHDKCWSTCDGMCLTSKLMHPTLHHFDFLEPSDANAECTNHFECTDGDRTQIHFTIFAMKTIFTTRNSILQANFISNLTFYTKGVMCMALRRGSYSSDFLAAKAS